jgi:hypothetical protein
MSHSSRGNSLSAFAPSAKVRRFGPTTFNSQALHSALRYVSFRRIASLYDEARTCCSASAFTAAVLILRKLLMNVSVNLGAPEGKSFVAYVEYLADAGYVPPNGKGWVDHIRKKGNEANHEIKLMGEAEAKAWSRFRKCC